METPSAPLNSENKLWIILCHLCLLVGFAVILPLVVYLVKKDESPNVATHAKEALNFHITFYIYAVICTLMIPVFGIGILMWVGLYFGSAILSIIAAVKASNGEFFRYPLTLRLVS